MIAKHPEARLPPTLLGSKYGRDEAEQQLMAKVGNPSTFSAEFNIDPARLRGLGVFDPTLAADTPLFIDPMLFRGSRHPEIRRDAAREYREHFETVIKFLAATKAPEDVAWRTARRLLEFHEVRGTCLG